jgi:hypothetical protein
VGDTIQHIDCKTPLDSHQCGEQTNWTCPSHQHTLRRPMGSPANSFNVFPRLGHYTGRFYEDPDTL